MIKEQMLTQQNKALKTIVVGYFMVQFALIPVVAMLPSMSRDLSITVAQSGWIMAIYLVSLTGLLLISGRLGDQFGYKRVFIAGTIIFLISSILCGMATSYSQLLVYRGLQGVGTALLSGNSLSLISKLFTGDSRGRAFGTVTTGAAMGSLIGILVSTLFTQFMSWRWLFLMIVPMAIYILLTIKNIEDEKKSIDWRKIDFTGAILLYGLLVMTMVYISSFGNNSSSGGEGHASHGTNMFSFPNPYILPTSIILVLCLLIFAEKKAVYPIIVFREFKNLLFLSSLSANLILHLSMVMATFFIPYLVENGLGLAPIFTGFVLISVELMNAIFPRISGSLYSRTKSSWIRPLGMAIIFTGFIFYWFIVGETSIIFYILGGAWIGIGMGIFWSVNNNIIMNSIQGEYHGFASGMLETTRQLGHTLAASISAVAMAYGMLKMEEHGTQMGSMDVSYIFDGTKNVIILSITFVFIGLLCSLHKERHIKQKSLNLAETRADSVN